MADNKEKLFSFARYQEQAMRTKPGVYANDVDMLANAALGLAGESGEFADSIKKTMYQRHELNRDNLVEEIGDILWYCALAAEGLGVPLWDIASRNVEKLKARYPDGFDAERSINRK